MGISVDPADFYLRGQSEGPGAPAPPAKAPREVASIADEFQPAEPVATGAIQERTTDYSVEISLAAQIAEMRALGMSLPIIAQWLGLDQETVESYL